MHLQYLMCIISMFDISVYVSHLTQRTLGFESVLIADLLKISCESHKTMMNPDQMVASVQRELYDDDGHYLSLSCSFVLAVQLPVITTCIQYCNAKLQYMYSNGEPITLAHNHFVTPQLALSVNFSSFTSTVLLKGLRGNEGQLHKVDNKSQREVTADS